ncbi:MAG: hypothetical protein NVS1B11_08860 [Terriglobales bacterium]
MSSSWVAEFWEAALAIASILHSTVGSWRAQLSKTGKGTTKAWHPTVERRYPFGLIAEINMSHANVQEEPRYGGSLQPVKY